MKNSFPACYLLKKEISRAVLHQTKYEKLEVTRALQTFYFKTLISLHQDSLVTEYHFFFGVIHLFYTSVSPSPCVPIAWSIKGLKWKPVPEGLYLFLVVSLGQNTEQILVYTNIQSMMELGSICSPFVHPKCLENSYGKWSASLDILTGSICILFSGIVSFLLSHWDVLSHLWLIQEKILRAMNNLLPASESTREVK